MLGHPDLQQARREAAERFYAIAMQALPKGYTYKFRKSLTGSHDGANKHINAPKPVTRKALYIWLHECAHAHLHGPDKPKRPRHVEEMEAEMWAHEVMRNRGIPVPRAMTKQAKAYVAYKIRQAERRGAKNIDAKARAYARRK